MITARMVIRERKLQVHLRFIVVDGLASALSNQRYPRLQCYNIPLCYCYSNIAYYRVAFL